MLTFRPVKKHDFWRSIDLGFPGHNPRSAWSVSSRDVYVASYIHSGAAKVGGQDDGEIWLGPVRTLQPLLLSQRHFHLVTENFSECCKGTLKIFISD